MLPVEVKEPLKGSKISAVVGSESFDPPAIRPLPFTNKVAVCRDREAGIDRGGLNTPVDGS